MTPYEYAMADRGLTEIRGAIHEQRILDMFAAVGHEWVKDDETAWCAAAMGYWLDRAGLPHTGKLNAQSYKDYGTEIPLSSARAGDIAVWRRGPAGTWKGHVAFVVRVEGNRILALGGNQSNMVKESWYPVQDNGNYKLLSIRRAVDTPAFVSTTTQPMRPVSNLLDFIAGKESGKDYEAIVWLVDKSNYPVKRLTTMTIGEILNWQDSIDHLQNSEAVGAYQILEDTLRGLYKGAGLSRNHVFNRDTQDRLGRALLERRGLTSYLSGEISAERFANNLAKEWASLPVVTDVQRGGRTIRKGQSYYAGDGMNRALTDVDAILRIVRAMRPGNTKPVRSPGPAAPRDPAPRQRFGILNRLFPSRRS